MIKRSHGLIWLTKSTMARFQVETHRDIIIAIHSMNIVVGFIMKYEWMESCNDFFKFGIIQIQIFNFNVLDTLVNVTM